MSRSHTFTHSKLLTTLLLLFCMLLAVQVASAAGGTGSGAVSLTTLGSPSTQNFDTLANTGTDIDMAINGWYIYEELAGTAADGQYRAGTGSDNAGDAYSFGAAASSERALGGLRSSSVVPIIGASFTNNTGSTVTSLNISYTGELWRAGVADRTAEDRLDFQYSINATSLITGDWTSVDSLDFLTPDIATPYAAGLKNGNDSANRTAKSDTISGLNIANGATFWIRWTDFDISSSDDGLSVDDFSITPNGATPADPVINEMQVSTTGTDYEFVEIQGTPGTDLSAYTLIGIESDAGDAGQGQIDRVISLSGQTIPADGFWVAANPTAETTYSLTADLDIPADSFENSTATYLLVSDFTGAAGNDLDTDNNGTLDVTPWAAIIDGVVIRDAGASDVGYTTPITGPDGSNLPSGVFRCPDGPTGSYSATFLNFNAPANGTPGATNAGLCGGDIPPTVSSTDPADNAVGVAANSNITITFSEAVNLTGTIQVVGGTSGTQNVTPTGGPTTFTLDPATDFTAGETVTVTVLASQVADQDGTAQNMAANYVFDFVVTSPATIAKIHEIQGSGNAVTGSGPFTVEAIVVGDYQTQGSGQLRGFFIQEEDADADANAATSEGIFVFCTTCPVAVAVGDKVQVTGNATEFFNMSQLTASTVGSVSVISSGNTLPTAATVELPVPGVPSGDLAAATTAINAYFEPFEGMLVKFPDTLSVSEYFELARYGQIILSEGGRPRTFTDANTPTEIGYTNHRIDLAARSIILDDTDNRENRPIDTPNTNYYHPVPGLSITNFFRGGDTITNLTGVLHWSFNGTTGEDAWRIRPVTEAFTYAFTPVNTRPEMPTVDGRLTVASFNVLNYFLSIDTVNDCGPSQNQDCRGADSNEELERQHDKMMAALTEISADVFGFMEMENTTGVEPLAAIVADLPGYDYIDTGVIGGDTIRVGIIYDTTTVEPVGDYAVISQAEFPGFNVSRNRPALAQTFEEIATGERFTVVVNHLKSKGSGCGSGDDDTTTGQGNCNGTRTDAAEALADWLATDPTDSGDPDFLIIGDLNSYAKEDPIVALEDAGYTNLVAAFGGPDAYGYVFDGQLGYLDHALSNASLTPQVAGVAEWHINADEIPLFDYNDDVRTADEATFEEESDTLPLYQPNEFRTSDHDPVIIGLDLGPDDTEAPAVTINQASGQADPTNTSPINFTVVFTETVSGFETGDVTLSGTAGATTALVTETGPMDGTTYNVAVSGMTGDGTVIATIAAGVAQDAASNGNTASTSTDNTVTYDTTAPDTTITTNPTDPSNLDDGEFRYESNEGGNQFECSLDGAPFSDCDGGQYSFFDLADGEHTFQVRAIDAAGNVETTPASYTWTIDTSEPAGADVYVTTTAAGTVDSVAFDKNDILLVNETNGWSLFYNGAGLPAKADLSAIHVNAADDLYFGLTQTSISVAGVGTVKGADLLHYNGSGLSLWFDGSDVGLTTTGEKIDSLHILPGAAAPVSGCEAWILISTNGAGKVPGGSGTLSFKGEDVLGFCATSLGSLTAGTWSMVLDGSSVGMPANSTYSLSANADGSVLYFTTKGTFSVGATTGGHSMVYAYDTATQQFSGPIFSAPAEGLTKKVDGMDYKAD